MELIKPDAALWVREQAIIRFPHCAVAENPPPGRLIDLGQPLLTFYSQDVARRDMATWEETIGYRVFDGTRDNPTSARELAAQVDAWLWTLARHEVGCPVADVDNLNGPNMVPGEYETAVLYGSADMVIAGVFPRH